MCSRKEIRSLTYSNLAIQSEFSSRKWKPPSDEVFNKLGERVRKNEQKMIADFLNLFYYFIVCYSKKCFKKHGVWQSSRYKYKANYNTSVVGNTSVLGNTTLPHEAILFNYEIANDNDSHGKILEIQRRMNLYRQEFKYAEDIGKLYLTNDKTREMTLFIEESLEIICTDIQEPVILTSYDIKSKIDKYTEDLKHKKQKQKHKSLKLNYAVLEALGIELS